MLADLENGVSSVWLTVGDGGVPVAGLEQALQGVYLDLAAVVLDAGADFAAAAEELLRLYTASGAPVREAAGCLGADPLGLLARTGDDAKLRVQLESAARMAARCSAEAPGVRALAVDALAYHEAGGSAAEELGTSLATGVAYLRQLTDSGLGIDDACCGSWSSAMPPPPTSF